MKERRIGDKRLFDKYPGHWTIKKIIKNKKKIFKIELKKIICPKCNHKISQPRNYTFDYIEELENGNETKYLGVSTDGRYILLDDYIEKNNIKNKMEE